VVKPSWVYQKNYDVSLTPFHSRDLTADSGARAPREPRWHHQGTSVSPRAAKHFFSTPRTHKEKELFDSLLPNVEQPSKSEVQDPVVSPELQNATNHIIQTWLHEKLSRCPWAKLIETIKVMSSGDDKSSVRDSGEALRTMQIDRDTLESYGIPSNLIVRLYRALWVYSLGFHEVSTC
jgi:hypothetical protein